ncbi:trypsin-like serine protease [Streptomyces phytophilus]|uniref:trypsin-like serine protease n=1 Tax=Streptomyces phytophilus TaxID=722715 RepID=UPI002867D4A0|nr:trypsin-like serine protease [Streptomyces phytophilus]
MAAACAGVALLATATPAYPVTGTPESEDFYGFTAKLVIGNHDRSCSAALVDSEWLMTAASCFADDPATSLAVPAGKPASHTTAVISRTDTTTTAGAVRDVVELVPRNDRDVVLARLSAPVLNVPPVVLAGSAPASGESLTATGYGRTRDEWAPVKLHSGSFTTGALVGSDLPVTGRDGAAVCKGDTGGPLFRDTAGRTELVGINSRSFQGGCFGTDTAQTSTDAISVRVDDLGSWVTATVGKPVDVDFNGDGVEDIASGDPMAAVGGDAAAGVVRVVYGGGKGVAEINQDASYVPGGAEPDDRFGSALAASDYNQDGCTDLIVGTPDEDVDGQSDAGLVSIVYGAPNGLGKGAASTSFQQGAGTAAFAESASEAGDLMGYSLAAGQTRTGTSYLLIGVPGEDLTTAGDIQDAGNAFYVHGDKGDKSVAVNQNKADIPGAAEADDAFGFAVAASANHLAIAAPGEAIGTRPDSGAIQVLDHQLTADGFPTPVKAVHQDVEGISGSAEAADEFGRALALADYRPEGAPAAVDSLLAVGTPGEAITVGGAARKDAGRVVRLHLTASGGYSEMPDIQQEKPEVTGVSEAGDRFGGTVAAINTAPRQVGGVADMLLAVGVPGEAEGGVTDSGAVQKFSLLGAPGDHDRWIVPGNTAGLPGTPGARERLGRFLTATGGRLYLGMPYGPSAQGAVHAMPWSNVNGGETRPVTTYRPGTHGLPAVGEEFGTTIQ